MTDASGANAKTPPPEESSPLEIIHLDLDILLTIDIGSIVQDRGTTTVVERGRVAWLDDVLDHLTGAKLEPAFVDVKRVDSAYARTDRYGRSTLSQDPGQGGLPVRLTLSDRAPRYAGSLMWAPADLEIGPSGAISIRMMAQLSQSPATSVQSIVSAYHIIRREAEETFRRLLEALSAVWNSNEGLKNLFVLRSSIQDVPCLVFDLLDFDFQVGGKALPPKELYVSQHLDALRALAGLTRMSSVFERFDEASVRNLAALDLGSRSDELWIVNEARLIRRHPDRGTNPFVDAFYEDVRTGIRLLVERASSLIFLMGWLKSAQSDLMQRLTKAKGAAQTVEVMSDLVAVLTEMSYLVSDPAHLEDTSGHSFFRNVMSRAGDRLALDARRQQIHDGYLDLLALSQALSSQHVATSSEELQVAALSVAKSSRTWAVLAVVFAVMALAITVIQFVIALRGAKGGG